MMRASLRQDAPRRVWFWRATIVWWLLLAAILAWRSARGTDDRPFAMGLGLLALGSIALAVHQLDEGSPRKWLWLVLCCAFLLGSMGVLWRAVS